jgi:hypothetical protein
MMKTIALYAALGAAVIFCGGAVWNLFPGHPNLSAEWFTNCVNRQLDDLQHCHLAQALVQSNELAVAACASHESRKIQKCHPVRESTRYDDKPGFFRTTMVGGHMDVTFSVLINYDNDWGRVQIAYYTVRLTRADKDQIEWTIANTEFAIEDKFGNLVAVR